MKELLVQIFTWWNRTTIGSRFYIWRFGTKVGEDEIGNVYYQASYTDSEGRPRRWVVYKEGAEASAIPPGWHGWMHHRTDTPPSQQTYEKRDWEKPHKANGTGTAAAYRPKGSMLNLGQRPRVTGDYDAWTPKP